MSGLRSVRWAHAGLALADIASTITTGSTNATTVARGRQTLAYRPNPHAASIVALCLRTRRPRSGLGRDQTLALTLAQWCSRYAIAHWTSPIPARALHT